jgi:threonine/homoserine/homoserine lactone efflux protein
MILQHLLKGMGIGFAVAVPIGPIAVLCIRRSLSEGPSMGFFTGLGVAVADALYSAVAAFGLTLISDALLRMQFWIGLLGGLLLLWFGCATFRAEPKETSEDSRSAGLITTFFSAFILTLTNPATILTFLALFVGLGVAEASGVWNALALVGGVFTGSALWWLLLSNGIGLLRNRFTPAWIRTTNRAAGVLISAFGVWALVRTTMGSHK